MFYRERIKRVLRWLIFDAYKISTQSQTCRKCGHASRMDFYVDDKTWNNISGKWSTLCYSCFDELAVEKNIKYKVIEYCLAGDNIKGKLYEKSI